MSAPIAVTEGNGGTPDVNPTGSAGLISAAKQAMAQAWALDTGRLLQADQDGGVVAVSQLEVYEFTFTQVTGDGAASTYVANCPVPPGYTVLDILFANSVLWNPTTTASLVIGDSVNGDVDGYYPATDVTASPAVGTGDINAWGMNLRTAAGDWALGKYYPIAGNVRATITVNDGGTHHAGVSRMAVLMTRGAKTVIAATHTA